VNLVVCDIPRSSGAITIEKPFTISFALTVSASTRQYQRRILTLVVQHVQPPRNMVSSLLVSNPPESFTPRLHSPGFSTPSPTSTTFNYALAHQKLLVASPRQHTTDDVGRDGDVVALPPPFFEGPDELKFARLTGFAFIGDSAIFLPPFELCEQPAEDVETIDHVGHDQVAGAERKAHAVHQFKLSYLPLRKGFLTIGGLRVLLVDDRGVNSDEGLEDSVHDGKEEMRKHSEVRILKEWDVVGEVWVTT